MSIGPVASPSVFDFPRTFHGPVRFRRLSATQIQTPLFSNFLFSFIFYFYKNTIIKTNVKYMMKLKEHDIFAILGNKIVKNLKIFVEVDYLRSRGVLCQP